MCSCWLNASCLDVVGSGMLAKLLYRRRSLIQATWWFLDARCRSGDGSIGLTIPVTVVVSGREASDGYEDTTHLRI